MVSSFQYMLLLALSAGFVGLVHSLAPGHWLPVVLLAKGRKWSPKTAALGAVVAASGHIILSIILGGASIFVGAEFLSQYESVIERYSGLGLAVFGFLFAGFAYFRHSSCVGHTHHGPDPAPVVAHEAEKDSHSDAHGGLKGGNASKDGKASFAFLFSIGLSPCIAAVPIFAAAGASGIAITVLSFVFFSLGVLLALVGSTVLVSMGLVKLDHPIFEHYGDVITGLGIAVIGALLFCCVH